MTGWLEGQATLISGGATGIGRALAHRIIEEGAWVGVLARDDAQVASLVDEFGDGVAPGGTRTPLSGSSTAGMGQAHLGEMPGLDDLIGPMTPLGPIADPEDHVDHYVLLASRHAGYTTGSILLSDGGIGIGKRPEPSEV